MSLNKWTQRHILKPYLVPPENCDVAERNFCATFAQFLPWSATFAQLWQISGCLGTNNLPFWGNLGANRTSEHRWSFFPKFVTVCLKIATSCLHTYFHSRCHCARVARLMTLQRSLQYSLRLSWTKTLFSKISNFCTSLDLYYNIDRRGFVVRCQNLPKYQSNILHPKMSQIARNFWIFWAQLSGGTTYFWTVQSDDATVAFDS